MKSMMSPISLAMVGAMAACGTHADELPDEEMAGESLHIAGDSYDVQDVVTHSIVGNARDAYLASVAFADTGLLTLDFAAPSVASAPSFPSETEYVHLPTDAAAAPITAVYGELRLPGSDASDVTHLLSTAEATFGLKSTADVLQIDELELTFPAAEVSSDTYTDSTPEVHLELPALTFPLP